MFATLFIIFTGIILTWVYYRVSRKEFLLKIKNIPEIELNYRKYSFVYWKIARSGTSGNPIIVRANCQICANKNKNTIISGYLRATSNFTTHLKRVHPEDIARFDNYKKINRKRSSLTDDQTNPKLKQLKMNSFVARDGGISKQPLFEKNLINFIINSMKPLSTVEDPNFIKLINDLDGNINIMSRRTLGRKINDYYKAVQSNLTDHLKILDFVSTTADVWSTKYRSFMGVTVHWIDSATLERKSGVLACTRFKGKHTFDKIAELLTEITGKFGLDNKKIMSTVTDNGSNFVKAFTEFGIDQLLNCPDLDDDHEYELAKHHSIADELLECDADSDFESILTLPRHLRCASHTLSLLATTDLTKLIKSKSLVSKIHHPAISKCNQLWNLSRKPKSAEIVRDALKCQLIFPCITRWNSMFDAIQQLVKHKETLNKIMDKLNISLFKQIDFEYLEEFIKVMTPIAIALDSLQGQNSTYYGQLLPTLFSLRTRLKKIQNETVLKFYGSIVPELIKCLQTRFDKFFNLSCEINHALIATSLHPLFKLRWLPENLSEIDDIKSKIQKLCIQEIQAINNEQSSSGTNESSSVASADDGEDSYILSSNLGSSMSQSKSESELQLIQFLADKNKQLSILNGYPLVKKAFIKFNSSSCSSAPVERLFSLAGFTLSPTRGTLSDDNFEKLMFLKGNENFLLN